jgi:hypothetical protein
MSNRRFTVLAGPVVLVAGNNPIVMQPAARRAIAGKYLHACVPLSGISQTALSDGWTSLAIF